MCDRKAIDSLQRQGLIVGSRRMKVNEECATAPRGSVSAIQSEVCDHVPVKRRRLRGISPQSRASVLDCRAELERETQAERHDTRCWCTQSLYGLSKTL